MNTIRYSSRTCDDQQQINDFLAKAEIGSLALADGDQPYVVPLNFVWYDNAIYFHGADAGRKETIMQTNQRACFLVCEAYGTIAHPVPAETDTAYMSVMVFGQVERVGEIEEATAALQQLLDKYVPGYYDSPLSKQHVLKYVSSHGAKVAVYKLAATEITAKVNPVNEAKMYYPGRKIGMDAKAE